jgi:hypothetical protein
MPRKGEGVQPDEYRPTLDEYGLRECPRRGVM